MTPAAAPCPIPLPRPRATLTLGLRIELDDALLERARLTVADFARALKRTRCPAQRQAIALHLETARAASGVHS
jgi:hypothetical protein